MNLIEPRVVLSIKTGESSLGRREFAWGTPVPPFSVGTSGGWPIQAPAVGETHLFLMFDGYRLYAAAASPAHDVSVDGVAIGGAWTHVAVPSLLAFGAASIGIDCEDAGRSVAEAIRPRPIIDLSRAEQQPTQVMDLSRTLQLHTVRLEISDRMLAELREAPAPEVTRFQPAPVQTQVFARPRQFEPKPPPAAELVNTLYDGGALRERAAQLASAEQVESEAVAAQITPAKVRKPRLRMLRSKLALFRRSSLPTQLTIALLPLAIAGVWLTPDSSVSAASSLAKQAGHAPVHPSASGPASAPSAPETEALSPAPTTPSASKPAVFETAPQSHDESERLALIAAFSGNKAEAAALYDRLAVTRNARVFALAARLTRDDRVRKP
jgi:hypothetical protein